MVGSFLALVLVSQCGPRGCPSPMATQSQGYYQAATPQVMVAPTVMYAQPMAQPMAQPQVMYAQPVRMKLFKRRGGCCN